MQSFLGLLLPRHMGSRHRFHLFLGVLDHLGGYVGGHFEDRPGELERHLVTVRHRRAWVAANG
jgi:hypothetical protein